MMVRAEPMGHWTEEVFLDSPARFAPEFDARLDRGVTEVADLMALLEETYDHRPSVALDVPCGVGRHAVPLAERGVAVDGVDLSPDFLDHARQRADDVGVAERTRFLEGDLRDLGTGGTLDEQLAERSHDLAIVLWTSIGYYDADTDRQFLSALCEQLDPGGAVVLELANREGMLADFQPVGRAEVGECLVFEQREYDPPTARVASTRWVLDREARTVRDVYEIETRAYAPVELGNLLAEAGFEKIHLFGSLAGDGLERTSSRLVGLGRRPPG